MMYRDHREYNQPPQELNHDILKSWLKGETGTDSLKVWLSTLYD